MDFGMALEFMKKGLSVTRIAWIDQGLDLYIHINKEKEIVFSTGQSFLDGLCSSALLAEDWVMYHGNWEYKSNNTGKK